MYDNVSRKAFFTNFDTFPWNDAWIRQVLQISTFLLAYFCQHRTVFHNISYYLRWINSTNCSRAKERVDVCLGVAPVNCDSVRFWVPPWSQCLCSSGGMTKICQIWDVYLQMSPNVAVVNGVLVLARCGCWLWDRYSMFQVVLSWKNLQSGLVSIVLPLFAAPRSTKTGLRLVSSSII